MSGEKDFKHLILGFILLGLGLGGCILMTCCDQSYGQSPTPAPTPADQSKLSEWWDWARLQDTCIYRISDKWKVVTGGGEHSQLERERLKVPGPPWKTPFGSMSREKILVEFLINGILRGLPDQGWNYQTHTTTGIGEGQWSVHTWGAE